MVKWLTHTAFNCVLRVRFPPTLYLPKLREVVCLFENFSATPIEFVFAFLLLFLFYLLVKWNNEKVKKQFEIQDYEDYRSYIKPQKKEEGVLEELDVLGSEPVLHWNKEGIVYRKLVDMDVKKGLNFVKELMEKNDVSHYVKEILIPYKDIQRIRYVLKKDINFRHKIVIQSEKHKIVFNLYQVKLEQMLEVIHTCLHANPNIKIDKVIMEILRDEKIPKLYVSHTYAIRNIYKEL